MAAHKIDPKLRKYGVCGVVYADTKMKLLREANKKGVNIGNVIGVMLDEWGKGQPNLSPDERQMLLFKEYREE